MEKRKHIPNPEGRPKLMEDGRNRTIYIDEKSWERAKLIGDGKPSEGIRRALATVQIAPESLTPTPGTRLA